MAHIAESRFIATDGEEYNVGDTIKEENLTKEYLMAMKNAGMIKAKGSSSAPVATKPAVTAPVATSKEPNLPSPEEVAAALVATAASNVSASQAEEVGSVSGNIPDLLANREASADVENTGNFQAPVGTVSGETSVAPASADSENGGSVVGTVSGDKPATSAKPATATKPVAEPATATKPVAKPATATKPVAEPATATK